MGLWAPASRHQSFAGAPSPGSQSGLGPAAQGSRLSCHQGLQGEISAATASVPCSCRVRSIIMLQEKAQDRERLLLKFIKIMKVTVPTTEAL